MSGRTSTSRSRSGRSSASSWTPEAGRRWTRGVRRAAEAAPERSGAPRVAIVGAGPAGLAAAEWLARAGAAVTILEEHPYPGGMVGGAIPAYRLPQAQIAQDLAVLERLGVELRYGVRVGDDVTVAGLLGDGFAAVFVAVGAQRGKRLGLPGEDAAGVLDGVEFLRLVREGRAPAVGPRVGVVGAGDTAMDCARSARRAGAALVQLVYRRTIDAMPADREEVAALREEGIEVVELARPVGVRVEDGRLAGLVVRRTAYDGTRDASGRKVPRDVPGSDAELPLDTLILAISQSPVLDLFGDLAPELTRAGFVATDPETLATSIPGVWAGGDVAADGPASIVKAAADGKRAAAAIARYLGLRSGTALPAPAGYREVGDLDVGALTVRRAHREYRVPVRATGLDRRGGFDETALPYTADEARREAARCLDCDTLCSLCVGVCPNLALLTYETAPIRAEVPVLAAARRGARAGRARGPSPWPSGSRSPSSPTCATSAAPASPPARRPAARTWTSRASTWTPPTSPPSQTTRSGSWATGRSKDGSAARPIASTAVRAIRPASTGRRACAPSSTRRRSRCSRSRRPDRLSQPNNRSLRPACWPRCSPGSRVPCLTCPRPAMRSRSAHGSPSRGCRPADPRRRERDRSRRQGRTLQTSRTSASGSATPAPTASARRPAVRSTSGSEPPASAQPAPRRPARMSRAAITEPGSISV